MVMHSFAGHSPKKKYLVGVSGGLDSVVLLHLLHGEGFRKLVVCHLDHGLRGAAGRADARFVQRLAHRLGYAVETDRAETRRHAAAYKQSVELAARQLRYAFFAACARRQRCPRLFLAHHGDDAVETSLFNFLRGAGAAGIAGMRPVSQRGKLTVIRPLLGVSRAQIAEWASAHSWRYREDASNASTVHTRNRIRHDVLPILRSALGESVSVAIRRAADILREEDDWMESLVPPVGETLSRRTLCEMPAALRRRTVLRWLRQRGVPEPGFQETERVLSLLDPDHGPARVSLPGKRDARRRAGAIFLEILS